MHGIGFAVTIESIGEGTVRGPPRYTCMDVSMPGEDFRVLWRAMRIQRSSAFSLDLPSNRSSSLQM